MKSIKHIAITLLIMILCSVGNIGSVYADVENRLDVEVVPGFNGMYKSEGYIPVSVTVTNKGKDFSGNIKIRYHINNNNDSMIETKVKILESKSVTEKFMLSAKEYNVDSIRVLITDDNDSIIYNEVNSFSLTNSISPNKKVVGILTEDRDALVHMTPLPNSTSIYLNADNFPGNKFELSMFNYVLINNYDVSKLNDTQLKELTNWVEKGGNLLIGTGQYYNKTINRFKDYLGIESIDGTKEIDFDKLKIYSQSKKGEPRYDVPVIVADLKGINQEYSGDTADTYGLVYDIKKGLGNVVVFGFDLGSEPLKSFPYSFDIVGDYFNLNHNGKFNNYNDNYYQIDRFMRGIPELKIPDLKIIIIIIGVYILLINPVLYLYLKKKKKRHYLWACIPGLAIIFVVLMYMTGLNTRIKAPVSQVINTVYFDDNDNNNISFVSSHLMLMSTTNKELRLKSLGNEEIIPIGYSDNGRYRRRTDNLGYEDYDLRYTTKKGSEDDLIIHNIGTFENCNFVMDPVSTLPNENKIEQNIYIDNSGLGGKITNGFDFALSDALVLYKKKIYEIDELKSKETVDMNSLESIDFRYFSEYFREKMQDSPSINEKYAIDQKQRIINYMYNLNNLDKYNNKKIDDVIFISWSYKDFYKGIEVNDNSIRKYEKTLVMTRFPVKYKKDMKYVIDYGEILPGPDNKYVNIERDGSYFYSVDKEMIVKYDIPKNYINIEKIAIKYDKSEDEIECWIVDTKGDKISFNQGEAIKVDDVDKYIDEHNKLKLFIKVKNGNEEKDIRLPDISIEGTGL